MKFYHVNFYIIDKLEENKTSCDSDWITYSDTKCFKVLDKKGTQFEAKNNCSAIDSTLINIESEKEQMFLSSHLAKYRGIAGNVWIGLEYVGNNFTWIDGNDMSYQNWDENAVKDGINECVDMLTTESNLGKWMDDRCTRKYLMACQKKQASINNFQIDFYSRKSRLESLEASNKKLEQDTVVKNQIIDNHQSRLDSIGTSQNNFQADLDSQKSRLESLEASNKKLEQDTVVKNQIIDNHQSRLDSLEIIKRKLEQNIISLEKSSIPIGFLYTQLPKQSSPQQLWPSLQWTEVTQQYAGLFFRAEGGESLLNGQIQHDNAPHLFRVDGYNNKNFSTPNSIYTQIGKYSEYIYTGDDYRPEIKGVNQTVYYHNLAFYISGGEVRPKNMATKIWKRTG